jgi:hypothetical protein
MLRERGGTALYLGQVDQTTLEEAVSEIHSGEEKVETEIVHEAESGGNSVPEVKPDVKWVMTAWLAERLIPKDNGPGMPASEPQQDSVAAEQPENMLLALLLELLLALLIEMDLQNSSGCLHKPSIRKENGAALILTFAGPAAAPQRTHSNWPSRNFDPLSVNHARVCVSHKQQ